VRRHRPILQQISPVNNAEGITKPLFIFQGLNDPRVPASESEQMVKTIRENGGEVWYLLASDEGHGVGKKSNRDFVYAAMALFLERYLLSDDQ
jgi:dipeptidyl aminopeptidase/acylaminoacyl peptidase